MVYTAEPCIQDEPLANTKLKLAMLATPFQIFVSHQLTESSILLLMVLFQLHSGLLMGSLSS